MAIYSEKNLYPGINAHLNSYLQEPGGGWTSFHAAHVIDLYKTINRSLPKGYYATPEESIQIAAYSADALEIEAIRPDVLLKQGVIPNPTPQPTPGTVMSPTLTLPIVFHITEPETVSSVVVYKLVRREGQIGEPVARVELLSPTNKPRGRHYVEYMDAREKTLRAGLCLVEIDFLHTQPPILDRIPKYATDKPAYPYHIIVTDPRPTVEKGKSDVYSFGVIDPLPIIRIPLADDDTVTVDFSSPYQETFEASILYPGVTDYAQEPVNFAAYTEADRDRIRQHMAQIAEKYEGQDN